MMWYMTRCLTCTDPGPRSASVSHPNLESAWRWTETHQAAIWEEWNGLRNRAEMAGSERPPKPEAHRIELSECEVGRVERVGILTAPDDVFGVVFVADRPKTPSIAVTVDAMEWVPDREAVVKSLRALIGDSPMWADDTGARCFWCAAPDRATGRLPDVDVSHRGDCDWVRAHEVLGARMPTGHRGHVTLRTEP